MLIKEVMTKTSMRLYESDLLVKVLGVFNQQNIANGLVYDHKETFIGVFTKLDLLNGLQENKKTLWEITNQNFKLLADTMAILEVDFGDGDCNPVQNGSGTVCGYLTREQFYNAYAKATQIRLKHYDAIFNSAHNGIISIDSFGKITSINPPAEKMAKTKKEDAIGEFLTDIVFPSGLLDVVRTGKAHTEKYKAGKRTYLTNRSPIMEDNSIVGAVGVFQDISEIEFISNELESVKQLVNELDTIINTSTNGICIVKNKRITKMNDQFREMFALEEDTTNIPGEIAELIEIIFSRRQTYSLLQKNPNTNHSLIITGVPLLDHENKINTIVINIKDMTEMERLRDELAEAKKALNTFSTNQRFVYRSDSMKQLMNTIKQIASVDVTVMITGESGVGKGEIANLIRKHSPRKDKPFVRVNCGAIPETLIESELFGYEPGAFTGASRKGKKGYFEQAENGTIFLDEIGELPQSVQVKLLTVLQDKEITRIGAEKSQKVDIRIIAATNRDLKSLVSEGGFREDLYYRLNVMPIHAPALREREEDIPHLIEHYINFFNEKYKKKLNFTEDAIRGFFEYHWPGNVRELINVMERIFVTSINQTIDYDAVQNVLHLNQNNKNQEMHLHIEGIIPLKEAIEEVEKQLITKALRTGKSYRQIAKMLEVNVSTISRKVKKYEEEIYR